MKKHVGKDFTDPNIGETAGRAGYRSGEKRGQKGGKRCSRIGKLRGQPQGGSGKAVGWGQVDVRARYNC